jgi:hypothetical protein
MISLEGNRKVSAGLRQQHSEELLSQDHSLVNCSSERISDRIIYERSEYSKYSIRTRQHGAEPFKLRHLRFSSYQIRITIANWWNFPKSSLQHAACFGATNQLRLRGTILVTTVSSVTSFHQRQKAQGLYVNLVSQAGDHPSPLLATCMVDPATNFTMFVMPKVFNDYKSSLHHNCIRNKDNFFEQFGHYE